MTTTTAMTTTTQESITRTKGVAELVRATEVPITLEMPLVIEIDTILEKEIKKMQKHQRRSQKKGEMGAEPEKVKQYNRYVLSGKGETPEQKVNKAVKDINYHNMVVVITVGDRTINNVGSIHTVAEK